MSCLGVGWVMHNRSSIPPFLRTFGLFLKNMLRKPKTRNKTETADSWEVEKIKNCSHILPRFYPILRPSDLKKRMHSGGEWICSCQSGHEFESFLAAPRNKKDSEFMITYTRIY